MSAHRLLQVAAGQLAVLGVMVENRAELEVRPGLDSLRGLELENRLETVNAEPYFGRTGGSEMFGKPEQGEVPALQGLHGRRHFLRQQQVSER